MEGEGEWGWSQGGSAGLLWEPLGCWPWVLHLPVRGFTWPVNAADTSWQLGPSAKSCLEALVSRVTRGTSRRFCRCVHDRGDSLRNRTQHFKYKVRFRALKGTCAQKDPEVSALLASCKSTPGSLFHPYYAYFCTSAEKQWFMFQFCFVLTHNWGPVIYFIMISTIFGGLPNQPLSRMSLLGSATQLWLLWTQRHVMHSNTASLYISLYIFHCRGSRDGWYSGHNSPSVPALLNFSLYVFRQIFGLAGAGWHIVLAQSDLLSQCHPFNTER